MPVKRIPVGGAAIRAARKAESMVAEHIEHVVAESTPVEPPAPSSKERQQAAEPSPGGLELRVLRDSAVDPLLSSPAPQREAEPKGASPTPKAQKPSTTRTSPQKPSGARVQAAKPQAEKSSTS